MRISTGQRALSSQAQRLSNSVPNEYTVYKEDATYYAEANYPGSTDYSGDVASTVIQAAINAVAVAGGIVHLKAGWYFITTPLQLPSYVVVEGETLGEEGFDSVYRQTIFTANVLDSFFYTDTTILQEASAVKGIHFWSTNTTGVSYGLKFEGVRRFLVEQCKFRERIKKAIYFSQGTVGTCQENRVIRNHIETASAWTSDTTSRAIYMEGTDHRLFMNLIGQPYIGIDLPASACISIANHVCLTGYAGIYVNGTWGTIGQRNRFMGDEIENNYGLYGMLVQNTYGNNLVGLHFANNQKHGLRFDGSRDCLVMGSEFINNGLDTTNTYDDIQLEGIIGRYADKVNVIGNDFYTFAGNVSRYGVNEILRCTGNQIVDNTFSGHGTAAINPIDRTTLVHHNRGFITEKNTLSDAFAIDGVALRTVTIAHGCAYTPNAEDCRLTVVEVTDVDDWGYDLLKVDTVDATNVTAKINVSNASATGGATAKLGLSVVRYGTYG